MMDPSLDLGSLISMPLDPNLFGQPQQQPHQMGHQNNGGGGNMRTAAMAGPSGTRADVVLNPQQPGGGGGGDGGGGGGLKSMMSLVLNPHQPGGGSGGGGGISGVDGGGGGLKSMMSLGGLGLSGMFPMMHRCEGGLGGRVGGLRDANMGLERHNSDALLWDQRLYGGREVGLLSA